MEQYISKAAVVAEIENRIKELQNLWEENKAKLDSIQKTAILLCIDECKVILSLLDTLEVKEVDLDEEINKYIRDNIIGYCIPDTEETAKHFFELGLKVQKGEEV